MPLGMCRALLGGRVTFFFTTPGSSSRVCRAWLCLCVIPTGSEALQPLLDHSHDLMKFMS